MIRFARRTVLVVVYAVLGAVAGRIAIDLRRRHAQGEPLEVNLNASSLRPQEVIPGLIAALRVRDRPWSYLHIPGWFAAFSVNFTLAALGRELQPLDGGADSAVAPGRERRTIFARADGAPRSPSGGTPPDDTAEGFTRFED